MTSHLERIQEALELTDAELEHLLGLDAPTLARWRTHGVPPERGDHVRAICATADLLERKLLPGQLPQLARRAAGPGGQETLLDALTEDPRGTWERYAGVFDYSTLA